MAIVKQCDRCNAIYENKIYGGVGSPKRIPKYIVKKEDNNSGPTNYASVMLCDNCLNELESFMDSCNKKEV